jgi:hypothetical protein
MENMKEEKNSCRDKDTFIVREMCDVGYCQMGGVDCRRGEVEGEEP